VTVVCAHEEAVLLSKYEITLRGEAGPTVRHAFAGFSVEVADGRTVLCGALPDQAALHGALDRIRDLGLELIEVRQLAAGPLGRQADD